MSKTNGIAYQKHPRTICEQITHYVRNAPMYEKKEQQLIDQIPCASPKKKGKYLCFHAVGAWGKSLPLKAMPNAKSVPKMTLLDARLSGNSQRPLQLQYHSTVQLHAGERMIQSLSLIT